MKTNLKNLFLLAALGPGLAFILPGRATAQTFTTLNTFSVSSSGYPKAGLVLSGFTLYGTTSQGYGGSVFAVTTDGSGFTTLDFFTTNGAAPEAGLVLSGNTLYGTASQRGLAGYGTVFALNTNGGGFTTLYSFTNGSDGSTPDGGVTLSGATLYGTTIGGGEDGDGTVFAVSTNGGNFTTLHSFTGSADGNRPFCKLVLSGNTVYGTAFEGGLASNGTVFAVNTDGTGFTTLHSFTATAGDAGLLDRGVNNDGALPCAGLILSGNTLYGTAEFGGSSGLGTVFAVNTDGSGFTTLHSFTATAGDAGLLDRGVNNDGAVPYAGLILSGNTLYGTAEFGGGSGLGTVFAVNTDGTGFTTLYSFTGGDDQGAPQAPLILSGNTLYGTTYFSGGGDIGTVFSLSLPPITNPQLSITLSGTNVVLTWPASATGFTLQSSESVNSLASAWSAVPAMPVVINGQNTVTNPISATEQFYQLSQ